ncbi:MAG: hypothetical protein TRG1_3131 [Flavobacteriaceae bacterium FS1-H7996/R]|nr:MAG: hypothetical protein TRG1_3131 [Flavobacteriaceae bacterium FS1-H7996/R]
MVAVAAALMTSCSNDDDNNSNQIETPATYVFTRDGSSTVSFGGQTTRITMAGELVSALKVNTNTAEQLQAMFEHVEGNDDFSEADLNASNKNVRSKVAASKDYFSANTTVSNAIKADFDGWIAEQANTVFVNWDLAATAGSAGQIQQLGGGSIRYVNGKGLELNQAVAKGLIGGLMADQMLNNYLSTSVLDEGSNIVNNNDDIVEAGKSYTTMEHKWDEGYGYLYGAEEDPAVPTLQADSFLNSYLRQVDADSDFAGIADAIYEAFKLGRAAIVAKEYDVRDAQVQIIRENISKVIAVRAVHYLQAGKASLAGNDNAKAFHELSEGFGFIYSLQFTRKPNTDVPYFTNTEVNAFVEDLMAGNGFWDVEAATLDAISAEIATEFGFTVNAAAN